MEAVSCQLDEVVHLRLMGQVSVILVIYTEIRGD